MLTYESLESACVGEVNPHRDLEREKVTKSSFRYALKSLNLDIFLVAHKSRFHEGWINPDDVDSVFEKEKSRVHSEVMRSLIKEYKPVGFLPLWLLSPLLYSLLQEVASRVLVYIFTKLFSNQRDVATLREIQNTL